MGNDKPVQPALNVLLHGGFAFLEGAEKITFLMPKSDHHVFRAGSWLAETELQGQREADKLGTVYKLVGVEKGAAGFDPEQALMVKNARPEANPKSYATLEFPRPKRITSLRPVQIP